MPRDIHIKRAFEVADDAMQGAIGYFLYGVACKNNAARQRVVAELSPGKIDITHDWERHYRPSDFCDAMEDCFVPYHSRVALIAVIGAFEGGLRNFEERLAATGKALKPSRRDETYKKRLERAFELARQSTYGTPEMQARIPTLCLDVDHARRIRNLWMHNNGLFDSQYANDVIQIPNHVSVIDPTFVELVQRRRRKAVPVVLKDQGFFTFARSHIELLHQIHDTTL